MNESRTPFDAEQFARDAVYAGEFDDWAISHLDDRVARLEELVAARWPRSMFVRRRLARELRASVAPFAWLGTGFRERRLEAVDEAVSLAMPRHRRAS